LLFGIWALPEYYAGLPLDTFQRSDWDVFLGMWYSHSPPFRGVLVLMVVAVAIHFIPAVSFKYFNKFT
jgi:hypothetical protein